VAKSYLGKWDKEQVLININDSKHYICHKYTGQVYRRGAVDIAGHVAKPGNLILHSITTATGNGIIKQQWWCVHERHVE
jgi:hypothetical protein